MEYTLWRFQGIQTCKSCFWWINTGGRYIVFDPIVAPVTNPQKIIAYPEDNDSGDGRHPEEVCIFYQQFIIRLREHFSLSCYFISIKPIIARSDIIDKIIYTNKLIEEEINKKKGNELFVNIYNKMVNKRGRPMKGIFEADSLHLNKEGYTVWKETILQECFRKPLHS